MTLPKSLSRTEPDSHAPLDYQHWRSNQDADEQNEPANLDRRLDKQIFINGLKRGDEDCYERLVREHIGKLLGVARRYLTEQEAQDVMQEAILKAVEQIATFRAESCLSTWLHRIVKIVCLSRLRRTKARRKIPLEDPGAASRHHGETIGAITPLPEQFESVAQVSVIVRRCLSNLPDTHRTVILLRDIEGYSCEETATFLCVSVNLVKVRLHRARRSLRDQLSMCFHETSDAEQSNHRL